MTNTQFAICPVCGNRHNVFLRHYRAFSTVFSNSALMSCQSCSLVFANPAPSHSELNQYNQSYFQNAHSGLPNNEGVILFQKALAEFRKEFIDSYISSSCHKVSNVLEVGPGLGFLAQCWLRDYPSHQYFVSETDEDCCNLLEAQGVLCNKRPAKHSIDLVIASHVLEHVSDPISFLGDIVEYIKPGGYIFIEVPCQDFLHKPLDEPHLLFFTDKSMKILLNRLGFSEIYASYYGRTISSLTKSFSLSYMFNKCRSRIARMGRLGSFIAQIKCQSLRDPLQKAVMLPYQPHTRSNKPAWWLRTMATYSK